MREGDRERFRLCGEEEESATFIEAMEEEVQGRGKLCDGVCGMWAAHKKSRGWLPKKSIMTKLFIFFVYV